MNNTKNFFIILIIGLSLGLLAACGGEEASSARAGGDADNETANISEQVDYTFVGIEPGAGMMGLAEITLEEYENLKGWELLEGSTAGMLVELEEAIKNEEPIIVAGWNPHWKFIEYDLKYLEDPKGTFGEEESLHTIVREGLKEDMPEAYEILDRFYWGTEDMEQVMYDARDSSFEEAAAKWVEDNRDKVNEWTEGVDQVEGESIELVSTQWDSEYASSEVMKIVLEEQGYNVTVTPVDPAVVFQAIANGEGDASLAPWLPITHGAFYEQHEGDFIDLGENLHGAKVGFVVPSYVNIDSIEDLEPKE